MRMFLQQFRKSIRQKPHDLIISKSFSLNTNYSYSYEFTHHSSKKNRKYNNVNHFSSLGKGFDLLNIEHENKNGDDGDNSDQGTAPTSILSFGDTSFNINGVLARQSVILLPNSFMLWNCKQFDDISEENLQLFTVLQPTFEMVLIGCGRYMPRPLPKAIYEMFRSKGIVLEVTNTVNAASTFNILNAEGRNVAAALLTMDRVNDHDINNNPVDMNEFKSGKLDNK